MQSQLSFSLAPSRPLPVLLLLDTSGSMNDKNKIGILNGAVADMLRSFSEENDLTVTIHTGVISFSSVEAKLHLPIQPCRNIIWENLTASGKTPLGSALKLAREILEDRQQIPSNAFAPTLVLVSDGLPTDDWKQTLNALQTSERASKAARFALAIGDDANEEVLREFVGSGGVGKVFRTHETAQIVNFFEWVAMSVTLRSRSQNPNLVLPTEINDLPF